MSQDSHISEEQRDMLAELDKHELTVKSQPKSSRRNELLMRIADAKREILNLAHDSKCKCGYCSDEPQHEAAYASNATLDQHLEFEEPALIRVANNFKNNFLMNKKVVAGILLVAGTVMIILGVRAWKKAGKAAA